MEDKLQNFLSSCSEIDFGDINLSDGEKEFYKNLNNEIILLCKSLPKSTQTDALLFFMRYSGISIGQELDFFGNYYVPSWSLIYWLTQNSFSSGGLSRGEIKNAVTAHSMAMILHSLDDHINDKEMHASHLTLLFRSQAWMIMLDALKNLSGGIDKGEKIVRDFIDEYYSGILDSKNVKNLESYCDLFKKQMATWLIVPVLMTRKMIAQPRFADAIQKAYYSFGIAWRLLDDIKDVETDMKRGAHSAIYVCLPENIRSFWENGAGEELDKGNGYFRIVLDYLQQYKITEIIKERICSELDSAASIIGRCNMPGFADELHSLSMPLKNGQDLYEARF